VRECAVLPLVWSCGRVRWCAVLPLVWSCALSLSLPHPSLVHSRTSLCSFPHRREPRGVYWLSVFTLLDPRFHGDDKKKMGDDKERDGDDKERDGDDKERTLFSFPHPACHSPRFLFSFPRPLCSLPCSSSHSRVGGNPELYRVLASRVHGDDKKKMGDDKERDRAK
jgi:hypothetical protein